MKTSLKANLLKHFVTKKEEGGFTLIELLVVIIIIGILAAIALPSFLNQANKAKQSEAKTYVGSMNRSQQAYYLENSRFADNDNIAQLGLGIKTVTGNYTYGINFSDPTVPIQFGAPQNVVANQSALKAYAGGVAISSVGTGTSTDATTIGVLCEALNSPIQTGVGDGTAITDPASATALFDGAASLTGSVPNQTIICDAAEYKEVK